MRTLPLRKRVIYFFTLYSLCGLLVCAAYVNSNLIVRASGFRLADPITTETAKLSDNVPTRVVSFGAAVAISGDTLAVGAPYDNTSPDGATDGAVSVYVRSGANWSLQQKLYFVNNRWNDSFGRSVALSGDTLVVGAPAADLNAANPTTSDTNEGAAVVFVRSGGKWMLQQVLRANDAQPMDLLGEHVAISGDTIAVGSLEVSGNRRATYLFTRTGTNWTQQQKFPSLGGVALNSDTLAISMVGGLAEDHVKIYTRTGTTWTPRQELKADPSNSLPNFGDSLALSEDYLVVGATGESSGQGNEEGSAYVFTRSGAGWVRKQKLALADPVAYDHFGRAVAVSGNTIVVGTQYDDINIRTDAGAAYVYTYNGTNWSQQQQLSPSDGAKKDGFGRAVAISGNTILVGSPQNGKYAPPGQFPYIPGAAYLFAGPGAAARPVANVSAASYASDALAPESIVTAFGSQLAMSTQVAAGTLPTQIAGTTVKVKDSAGVERMSPLFFVSPSQINYQVPAGTASGAATVTVTSGDGTISAASVQVNPVFPGLFTADASGRGLAAAVVLRVKADGKQSYEPVAHYDSSQNRFVASPIDMGAEGDQVFLLLFGTGIRNRSGLAGIAAKVGGTNAPVSYAGAQNDFVGLDQVNALLPRSLAGRGELDVVLTADGRAANTIKINVK